MKCHRCKSEKTRKVFDKKYERKREHWYNKIIDITIYHDTAFACDNCYFCWFDWKMPTYRQEFKK